MILRDYQVDGIRQIKQHIDNGHRRILFTMPTGSGKGSVISTIIKANPGKVSLFLVHRRELVFDMSRRLSGLMQKHAVVGPGLKPVYDAKAYVSTIQSWLSKHKQYGVTPDIIIIDECHLFNPTNGMYKRLLEMYPKAIVLGFTATPTRSDRRGLGAIFTAMVHPLTFSRAFAEGYLVRPRYYTPTDPDLSTVKSLAGDYQTDELASVMEAPKLVGDIVAHYQKYGENRKTIGFAVRVVHSKSLADAFNLAGIPSAHVDGNTPLAERDAIFEALRSGELQVLWNVDVCSEGVDIPDIGCVISARPTKSIIKWLQQLGRGLRPAKGKSDCLVFDHGGTFSRLGAVEDYETWVLDDARHANQAPKEREKKKEKAIKELTCEMCATVFSGTIVCPSCGYIHYKTKMPEYVDGDLVEVTSTKRKAPKKSYSESEKEAWLSQLYYIQLSRQYKPGWTKFKYKEKFGYWPYESPKAPMLPTTEVLNWIKHTRIRNAHRRDSAA